MEINSSGTIENHLLFKKTFVVQKKPNVVQKVPWNFEESSMELFDQKVSMSIEKRFWMIFCYVMGNVGNAYKV